MFTQNFINHQNFMFTYDPYYGSDTHMYVTNAAGQSFQSDATRRCYAGFAGALRWGRCQAIPTAEGSNAHNCGYGLYFGSGTNPATKDDYTLQSPITSGLTITNMANNCVFKEESVGVYSAEANYILQNTTGSEININEIGVFLAFGTSSLKWLPALVYREVLSEAVAVPAGEFKAFAFRIKINHPVV